MTDQMTGKERWIASVTLEPTDRLIFWPKFTSVYPYYRENMPFKAMSNDEITDWIGGEADGWLPEIVKETRTNTSFEILFPDENTRVYNFITKYGTSGAIHSWDSGTMSWHPTKFPIKTLKDIKIVTAWYRDINNEVDFDLLEEAKTKSAWYGDKTIVTTTPGGLRSASPIMHFLEWFAGIENGHYLLADYQSEVEELFAVMHEDVKEKTLIHAEHSPAELIGLSENTSTHIISPDQYKRYCFDYMNEYAQIAHDYGKFFQLHMCGHLYLLLPQLSKLKVDCFEALTPPTVGDTDLVTARNACPDKGLSGGTHPLLWLSTPANVIEYLDDQLARLPHHRGLVISGGDAMTPLCEPEFIKKVCDFVKNYKVRN